MKLIDQKWMKVGRARVSQSVNTETGDKFDAQATVSLGDGITIRCYENDPNYDLLASLEAGDEILVSASGVQDASFTGRDGNKVSQTRLLGVEILDWKEGEKSEAAKKLASAGRTPKRPEERTFTPKDVVKAETETPSFEDIQKKMLASGQV